MGSQNVASRSEWLAARRELLEKEKDAARIRELVNAQRRQLPWVLIDKEYVFDSPAGQQRLLDLFDGRRQLLIYHFMSHIQGHQFCQNCSFWIDNIGHLAHLHARDTSLVVDCPVPIAEIESFTKRMGWTVPWVSSLGSSFHEDLFFALDTPRPTAPGVSAFIREGDQVYHTYSTQGGSDLLNGTYNYLDVTPLGRQEEDLPNPVSWVRYHDEYA